jgi:DNA-binding transcriptional regulator LsrR (DeoR family)
MNDQNTRLIIKIAKLYYENNLTQEEIAKKLRISRPRISRLLQQSRESGIVQIRVATFPSPHVELESSLEKKFGLDEVIVVDVSNTNSHFVVSQELGEAAAAYFRIAVQDGDVIGLTWGETLSSMIDHLVAEKKQDVMVVQTVGGLGAPASESHATDLVRRLSLLMGANWNLMPAPGIVSSAEAAGFFKNEPYIQQALEIAARADIVFAGIGAPSKESLLMRDESIITWGEINPLIERKAVGEIGLHFYDVNGHPIESDVEKRVIGLDLDCFHNLPNVVGVAGGMEKAQAILGAVRGGYIKTLITDTTVAEFLNAQ